MTYNIEEFKLNYRAMIPFYILLDEDLSKTDLKLYGLIEQMESSLGNVYYTNRAIGEILSLSIRNIQLSKRRLQEKNYLECEYKEIVIKGKKVWMHCWNTVKGSLMQKAEDDPGKEGGDAGDHPSEGDEVQDHPTPETQDHPTHETQDHPCNALDLKAFRLEEKTTNDVVIFDSKTDKTILKKLENLPQGDKSMIQLLKEIHYNVKKNFDKNMWKGIYGSLSLISKGDWTTPGGYVDQHAIDAEKAKIKAEVEARLKFEAEDGERRQKAYVRNVYESKGQTPPDWCMA